MKNLIILLALFAFSCENLPSHIYLIESNRRYGVYDSRMDKFIYYTRCDSAILDKDSIVTEIIPCKYRMCYWQSDDFRGYISFDSSKIAAKAWFNYAYKTK